MKQHLILFAALFVWSCDDGDGDPQPLDAAPLDASTTDVAPIDASTTDGAPLDASTTDVAPIDASTTDVAPLDASTTDVTPIDASTTDVAPLDASTTDVAPIDASTADVAPIDASTADVAPIDASVTDAVTPIDMSAEEIIENPYDLPIQAPQTYTLPCESEEPFPMEDLVVLAQHWLCTFEHGEHSGHVYVQSTPIACRGGFGTTPEFEAAQGWISIDGVISPLSEVLYDWGGNHHNDSIDFAWDGREYRYYHSSFGFGWRQCQEMDCLQVSDASGALLEDGCQQTRTLPVICRAITEEGTWGAFVDTFAPCAGDPNYP